MITPKELSFHALQHMLKDCRDCTWSEVLLSAYMDCLASSIYVQRAQAGFVLQC